MKKIIPGIFIFMLLVIALSSCASGAPSPNAMGPAESSRIQRSSENETDDRMIAYSVSLGLSVKNTDDTRKAIVEEIKNYKGFIVRETENDISTRIPTEDMDNFLNTIKALGKIDNESKTGTDITDQYRDNTIRLNSLKNVRDRYLTLLERANNVNDMISIEKELERVNLEIERLEGRIRHAELSVSYSMINIRFVERIMPGHVGWIFYGLYHAIKWLFVWN
jgi:hypothetical protein